MIGRIVPQLVMWWAHRTFKPVPGQRITDSEIYNIFKGKTSNIWTSDASYDTARKKDIEKFLSLNYFRFRQYVPEKYDCDNYSFALMGMFTYLMSGYAVGIAWVETGNGAHALNFFIDENKEFWYIEPQNNNIFQEVDYTPYLIII